MGGFSHQNLVGFFKIYQNLVRFADFSHLRFQVGNLSHILTGPKFNNVLRRLGLWIIILGSAPPLIRDCWGPCLSCFGRPWMGCRCLADWFVFSTSGAWQSHALKSLDSDPCWQFTILLTASRIFSPLSSLGFNRQWYAMMPRVNHQELQRPTDTENCQRATRSDEFSLSIALIQWLKGQPQNHRPHHYHHHCHHELLQKTTS